MSVDVNAIRARLGAAQPGPWQAVESAGDEGVWWVERRNVSTVAADLMGADAEFIAHAPADIAALLDALAADEAERAAALARLAKVEALVEDFESEIDWSDGRSNYGDNEAWQQAADRLRAALEEKP